MLPAVTINELYKVYSMADFTVFPLENTLSALDAQVCRLPLIMENDRTNQERLDKGGLLYQKDDIDDLAARILELMNSSSVRESLGSDGEEFGGQKFSYENITWKLEQDLGV